VHFGPILTFGLNFFFIPLLASPSALSSSIGPRPLTSVLLFHTCWRLNRPWTLVFRSAMTALLRFALLYPLLLLLHIHQVISSSDYLPLVGTACNPNNTRLLLDNNQLKSDCGYVAWCDTSDNTCKARGCRRDEYPFGYNTVERSLWPPLCSEEQFCPDEGSSCINKVGLGQGCQLNRDGELLQSREISKLESHC
jgi:hypothetical protein